MKNKTLVLTVGIIAATTLSIMTSAAAATVPLLSAFATTESETDVDQEVENEVACSGFFDASCLNNNATGTIGG